MNIVIIIPTYNEKENIVKLLDLIRLSVASVKNHTISYLVVDDTSPDGTADEVRAYAKKHARVELIVGKKEGLGNAILRGMDHAVSVMHADYILQMDADLSHDVTKIPEFLKSIDAGADMVVGSRYIKGGSIPENWGLHRKIFSVVANLYVRFGLGHPEIHDWTGGYRAYDKRFVMALKGEMKKYSGYLFQIAFLDNAVRLGAKVHEVPFHFTDRQYGISKIYAAEYIRHILLYVLNRRITMTKEGTFGRFMVVGGIGFIFNTIVLMLAVRLGMHPSLGAAMGAECAIISNFILNNAWTFKDRSLTGLALIPKFLQFNLTSFGAVVIQSGTIYVGTHLFGLPTYFFFYLLGVGIGLVWNYIMYSKVIWKKS
jgi:dolichol-phosphate mannosyltransferase